MSGMSVRHCICNMLQAPLTEGACFCRVPQHSIGDIVQIPFQKIMLFAILLFRRQGL